MMAGGGEVGVRCLGQATAGVGVGPRNRAFPRGAAIPAFPIAFLAQKTERRSVAFQRTCAGVENGTKLFAEGLTFLRFAFLLIGRERMTE